MADIIESFFPDDAHLSQACKYLLRAGRKPDSSYLKDCGKALWWIARAIMYHGGTIDLPKMPLNKLFIRGESVKSLLGVDK